ncbi:MAG: TonB-dependent receptor plug domain-containing protein, partial [Planctomycetota bacterium]
IPEETSSTRSIKPLTRAPSTVTVLTGEELRRSGARFLTDGLRMLPGLEVQRTTSTESNVTMRGYNDSSSAAQGVLVMINGRNGYNEFFGNAIWDSLLVSMDEVEQIEVIRGPGSMLYGPNAMHGLVNIKTKSPMAYEEDYFSVSSSYGSYYSNTSRATYVKRDTDSRAGLKATVQWDDISEFGNRTENAKDKIFGELVYEKHFDEDGDHGIEITGGVADQKIDVLLPALFGGLIPTARLDTDIEDAFVMGKYHWHDLKIQTSWTSFDASVDPDMAYSPFDVDLDTVDVDAQYSFDLLAGHALTIGSSFRYAVFTTEDPDVSDGRHDTEQWGAFIQDEVTLVPSQLWLTAGMRYDWHSTAGDIISPRAALVYEFAPDQSLRASYGKGFRNPSLREIWFDLPVNGGSVLIEGNEDLEAETMESYELGYLGKPADRLKFGLSGFYNRVDDLAVFAPTPAPPPPVRAAPFNQSDEEAYGFEVEADYLILGAAKSEEQPRDNDVVVIERQAKNREDALSFFGNYSWNIRRDRGTNDRNPLSPRNKANAGLRYSSGRGFDARLWVNYVDDTEFEGRSVDEYATVNGSIGQQFVIGPAEGEAFIRFMNLFDNDHRENPDGDKLGLILTAGVELEF